MIELGTKVKDLITGFTGVAVARTEWLYGCARIVVESCDLKDGVPISPQWFDEQRVEEIEGSPKFPVSPARCGIDIQLGYKVKDKITGFAGTAVGKTIWSSGNVTFQVEASELSDKKKPIETQAFEYHRLELVQEAKAPMSAQANPKAPGGPRDDPKQAM
jgi:hypothetical protein